MDRDNIRGSTLFIDSLDKPNSPLPNQQQTYQKKSDWRYITAGGAIGIIFSFSLFLFVFYQLKSISDDIFSNQAKFADVLVWLMLLAPIVLLIGLIVLTLRWVYIMTKRAELVNVMDYQLSIDNLDKVIDKIIQPYLQIKLERAHQSQFQGVSNLTYNEADTIINDAAKTKEKELAKEESKQLDRETLLTLREKGLINRSNDSILIGFSDED